MFSEREINRIKVAVKLADNFHLSVEDVMGLLDCDRDFAAQVMHELTLIGVGSWNSIDGRLDYNLLWS